MTIRIKIRFLHEYYGFFRIFVPKYKRTCSTYCEATVSKAVQQHDYVALLHGFNVSVIR